jgi:hypothetical protein
MMQNQKGKRSLSKVRFFSAKHTTQLRHSGARRNPGGRVMSLDTGLRRYDGFHGSGCGVGKVGAGGTASTVSDNSPVGIMRAFHRKTGITE